MVAACLPREVCSTEPALRFQALIYPRMGDVVGRYFSELVRRSVLPWAPSFRGALPVYATTPTVPGSIHALPYSTDDVES